jgi:hypothetical protein
MEMKDRQEMNEQYATRKVGVETPKGKRRTLHSFPVFGLSESIIKNNKSQVLEFMSSFSFLTLNGKSI